MSMATRTDTQSPALHVADSHDLMRVRGARENNPIILRSARGAQRYSPKSSEEKFCELRLYGVLGSLCTLGYYLPFAASPSCACDEHQSATRLPTNRPAHAATAMGPISKRTTSATPPSMVPGGPPPANEFVSNPNTAHAPRGPRPRLTHSLSLRPAGKL